MPSTPGVSLTPSALPDADSHIRTANDGANPVSTTLTAGYTAGDATVNVADTSLFPASGVLTFVATGLILTYTAKTGTTFTGCARAANEPNNPADANQANGATVEARITARQHSILSDDLVNAWTKLGPGSSTPPSAAGPPSTGGFLVADAAISGGSGWTALADLKYDRTNKRVVASGGFESPSNGQALLLGTAANLNTIVGFYQETSYARGFLTHGSTGTPIPGDAAPTLNIQRRIAPDNSSGLPLVSFNHLTIVDTNAGRVNTTSQDHYGLWSTIYANYTQQAVSGRNSVIAAGSKALNIAGSYCDAYGWLSLVYNYSATARSFGCEYDTFNASGVTASTIQNIATANGQTIGLNLVGYVSGAGSSKNSCAILIQAGSPGEWLTGLYFNTGAVDASGYMIDLASVTTGAVPLRLPNNQPIKARNAANSADIPILRVAAAGTLDLQNDAIRIVNSAYTVEYMQFGALGIAIGTGAAPSHRLDISGTATTDVRILNVAYTWNNSALQFRGLFVNFIDTASRGDSLLMDLQVGGSSKFKVDKYGNIRPAGRVHDVKNFQRHYDAVTSAAATLSTVAGIARVVTSAVAATNQKNARGEWLRISATANNAVAKLEPTTFTETQLQAGPIFRTRIEIPTALTNRRIFVGMFSAAVPASESLATVHAVAFRYSTGSGDTTFVPIISNGTAQAAATNVAPVTVVADTVYDVVIDCSDPTNVRFYINYELVAVGSGANLPTVTQGLAPIHHLTSLSASGQKDLHVAFTEIQQ